MSGNDPNITGKEQCDRCRDELASVQCIACGVDEPMRFCSDCDNLVHQIIYKQQHKRNYLASESQLFSNAQLKNISTGEHSQDQGILILPSQKEYKDTRALSQASGGQQKNASKGKVLPQEIISHYEGLTVNKQESQQVRQPNLQTKLKPQIDETNYHSFAGSPENKQIKFKEDEGNQERSQEKANYYSKEYVEDLQAFYSKERDDYRMKLVQLERELDQERERMKGQIDNLKRQLDRERLSSHEGMQFKTMVEQLQEQLQSKNQVICEQQTQIREQQMHISRITDINNELNEQLEDIKMTANAQGDQANQSIKHYQEMVEKMRVDHTGMVRSVQDKLESDKLQLKKDYESLIENIRKEYQDQKNELREYARGLEMEVDAQKREFSDLKNDFENKIGSLQREFEFMERQLKMGKGDCDKQAHEKGKLEKIISELEKENKILNNEISLLDDENQRFKKENASFRNQIQKMDKILYGTNDKSKRKIY